jgi:hypothetical protein
VIKIPTDSIELKSLELVWAERLRQKEAEGYTPAHDDEHTEGQLALLAAAYAVTSRGRTGDLYSLIHLENSLKKYGWAFKPKDPISDLVRAGALILAELERWLRTEEK